MGATERGNGQARIRAAWDAVFPRSAAATLGLMAAAYGHVMVPRLASAFDGENRMASASAQKQFLDPDLLKTITEQIVGACDPVRVILFGSHAEGQATPDSDIDLLVVTDEALSPHEQWERRPELYRYTHTPIQILSISKERFEETRDVIGGIACPAVKYGFSLYERS